MSSSPNSMSNKRSPLALRRPPSPQVDPRSSDIEQFWTFTRMVYAHMANQRRTSEARWQA